MSGVRVRGLAADGGLHPASGQREVDRPSMLNAIDGAI